MVSSLLSAALLLNGVAAFPHIAQMVKERELAERIPALAPFPEFPGAPQHAFYNKFDAEAQLLDVTGEHEFRAPGPNDIRGPCSGLNAAANHGYLPRTGIMTAEAINTGLWEAFSLDKTATIFLQTATMFFDGDPISGKWVIGPPKDSNLGSLGPIGGLLGSASGICGGAAHLKTEGDSSITRGDYLAIDGTDNNCISYPKYLQELFDLADQKADGLITPQVLAEHSYNRKQHSIATNPNYYSPAYAGVAFTFGAHMFAYELLANHSAEYPRGFMTQELFKSMWSYTDGPNGELVFTFGHERIPENWYRRARDDAWTLTDILISTGQQCVSYPSNCQVGGNTGEVNSFSGVDLGNITGGLINAAEDLQDPDRLGCFISQMIQADVPSFLDNVATGAILNQLTGLIDTMLLPALAPLTAGGKCPNLPKGKSVSQYGQRFPGAISKANHPVRRFAWDS